MSSISGIGQSLFQYFQSITAAQQSPTSSTAQPNVAADGDSDASGAQSIQGSGHHGHGGFFNKIAAAVTSALDSAQSSGTSDPNQVIQNAIANFLSGQNSAAQTPATTTGSQATPVNDPDGAGDTDAPGQADGSSTRSSFLQTLQSFGVDPEQFRQDFLAAIQDNGGGQANPQAGALPPGSLVDETA